MSGTATEIAVVGGGVVGMVTALLLATAGREVTLVDSLTHLPALDEPWDLRSFALTPASRRILAHCGLWEALDHARIATFEGMEIRDAASPATLRFDRASAGDQPLAYLVEQSNLITACNRRLAQEARVSDLAAQVLGMTTSAEDVRLHLGERRELRSRVVLACDGRDSPLRALAGIASEEHDYQQRAVVANVRMQLSHGGIARQRFLPEGPLALLPLPSADEVAVVWTTTPEQAVWAEECEVEAFRDALAQASDAWLGEVLTTSRRLGFPLVRRHAQHYAAERLALVGDSAHVVHPLAGQGLNLGLLDAAAIAEELGPASSAALQYPQSLLARYSRARRGGNLAMLTVTDQLNRLFARRESPIIGLRRVGLAGVDRWAPLKRRLIADAMGQRGDLPLIARPGPSNSPITRKN
jgi:ubiquinone biosynthesis UbiH/UbiF/VisC/COQ6 family hydroxylase